MSNLTRRPPITERNQHERMEMPGADWIDVSVNLATGMSHWPGDPEVVIARIRDLAAGDDCTVGHLSLGAHTGTHLDAPAHFIAGGATLGELPLSAVIGRARVIGIDDPKCVTPEELGRHRIERGERILLKTANSPRAWESGRFVPDFVYVNLAAAEYLASAGIRTLGVDYLSVGPVDGDSAAIHRALLEAGIWIIEGLNLEAVPVGEVELVCLPLRIDGAEGAPARVVVRVTG